MLINENNIEYVEMVLNLKKPGKDILATLTPEKCDLLHMTIGITDEMREVHEAYDELIVVRCIDKSDEKVREHLVEELGDALFYLTGFSDSMLNVSNDWWSNSTGKVRYDLLDVVKKHVVYNKPLDLISVVDCFNSTCSMIEYLAASSGIELKEVIEYNMQKLGKRYGKVYTDEAAQARRDKAEGE